jgi:2-dehydro-3-deoxy-D-arabinonate dehydratase
MTPAEWPAEFEIRCRFGEAHGPVVWEGETSTTRMKRSVEELVSWLVRDNPVAPGTVLLTGTGLVPPDDVALRPGQRVEIEVTGIGSLENPVCAASDLLPKERSSTNV